MRLVVAIPCYDTFARETALSLAMMAFRIGQDPPAGIEFFGIDWRSTSNLPESRHVLAARALDKHKATHILWVDSDSVFPADSAHRLLARDVDIVGCTFARRMPPHTSSVTDLDGKVLSPQLTGMTKVGVMGFGLLLTRATVFEREYEMPLFAHHDEDGYCTEDVTFSKKVRKAGFDLWCDMDLSRMCRHVGSIAHGFDSIEG